MAKNDARDGERARGRARWRSGRGLAARRDRQQNAEHREVGQHGGAAVAQERRHHAGERQHAERSAGDQQDLQRRGGAEAGGQEEFVIGARAQGDAEAAIDQECVQREDRRDAEQAPLLAERGEDQVGMRRRARIADRPVRCPCPAMPPVA